ncbi:phosphate acyltransferase PlsX [Clostridium kluyveri]|uniref:Phosphate acyltransferase n=2 Tax=Clostridium kluyveri TaxID=1534 RepID=PLSX_CLOK5|nr:phosphate acyltransferase PlsX [Clostridium kluyveri]A5N805.1 RecName: Full=Phosphate acyltransferase; AltName: Full=Acyl-ACP phosphotransacylase; AltName: Full=Acyl-[acyl-carrier-protein]--phosphate acyltransferase; AltName: Full=Phosphate-acyl-ACP acyltransferase [Clostridium kluyveri DSM 555]B9E1G6.1 RecName: Full=Phosphate acyltransferase; AltName: Full=Acyl-ACP phosphotransacylase; AltName: Full=Acyl-[acyl-carrier-protein]--phosphate acyltransferase; AltName: Full=Phosphate-acyl-ACP acylt
MIIAVDGMGGDFAPYAVVEGIIEAVKEQDINIIITGKKELIEAELKKYEYEREKIRILDTREVITTSESPVMALRRKKDSSLVKALQLVKEGKADAAISAGSTGALMSGATLIVGRIKGIERVALAPMIPGKNGAFMIIDAGANVDCKPHYLLQFSLMGKIYFENVLKIKEPSIGLVNIGTEEEKGNELTKNTYKLLKDMDFNFVGNVEPREATNGDVNILVCDGFVGNTILKTYEGVSLNLIHMIKEEIMKSTTSKLAGVFLKPVFKKIKSRLDYSEYGGSAFLGCKGICVKAHGSSNGKAFKNAIKQAVICYDNKVIDKIKFEIEKIYNREE